MPVWITSPEGTITYLNTRAEMLTGKAAVDCVGRMCHLVIAARTPEGAPLCSPRCRVKRLSDEKREIGPMRMRVSARGARQDVKTVVIALDDGQLVHCVVDTGREKRLRKYIDRVALRTPNAHARKLLARRGGLTSRETEVLRLLADDVALHDIAAKLGVSYTTVRNHVQHILNKLGVHSILEAVAVYLLKDE